MSIDKHRAGLTQQPLNLLNIADDEPKLLKTNSVPPEDNMLLVSWFEDPLNLQKEQDVSVTPLNFITFR